MLTGSAFNKLKHWQHNPLQLQFKFNDSGTFILDYECILKPGIFSVLDEPFIDGAVIKKKFKFVNWNKKKVKKTPKV